MKPLLCLLMLALAGCDPAPSANGLAPYGRVVAETTYGWVRVMTIDGHDYIIVTDNHGVAICPKTP